MMDLGQTKQLLEQALGIVFRRETLASWPASAADSAIWEDQGTVYFFVHTADGGAETLATDAHELSHSEKQLIALLVQSGLRGDQSVLKPKPQAMDEEGRMRSIGEWLAARLDEGDMHGTLPDKDLLRGYQYDSCIALLLDTEFRESNRFTYKELKKLIDTYFESDTMLIPLSEREWVVLASDSVLTSANEDGEPGDSTEELLESIALALHEMIIEWIGECRVSAARILHAPTNLLMNVASMRDAVRLGRLFHVEEAVHLPWKLHLERLLISMEDREKRKFLDQLMRNAEHTTLDAEMLTTLRAFFHNDCNISETSKELYIHRNTLLYRLDKFKQATGMDVRRFHDAVLVHMALLLYKVTKRD